MFHFFSLAALLIGSESFAQAPTLPVRSKTSFEAELYTHSNVIRPDLLFVTVGGSEGGWDGARIGASQLAKRGFRALALPYWGLSGLPAAMDRIELGFFQDVFSEIRRLYPRTKIVFWGSSRGGELALLLATFPWAQDATVSIAGSAIGMYGYDFASGLMTPAWTYRSRAIPHLRPAQWQTEWIDLAEGIGYYSDRKAYLRAIQGIAPLSPAVFRLEQSRGPLLIAAAEDDQIWPSCALTKPGWQRLAATRRKHDAYLCLKKAGHDLALPGVAHPMQRYVKLRDGTVINYGGDPAEVAASAAAFETALYAWLRNVK